MADPMAEDGVFRRRSQVGSIRAEERRRWSTAEVALVHSDSAFLAEALSQASGELEQALAREAQLQTRVAQLEAHCQSLASSHAEMAEALEELTAAHCRAAHGGLCVVASPVTVSSSPPGVVAPARRSSCSSLRHSRRFRQLTWKATWDEPPDDLDVLAAARVNPPWYARRAVWAALVFVGAVVVALVVGAEQGRRRQADLRAQLPVSAASLAIPR